MALRSGPRWDELIVGGTRRRRRPRWFRMLLRWTVTAVLVVSLGMTGAYTYAQLKLKATNIDVTGLKPSDGQRVRTLIAGTMTAGGGTRLAFAHLLQIDGDKAILVDIPVGLQVRGPDGTRKRLDEIFVRGRSPLVKQVAELSGMNVDHYLELRVDQIARMANATEYEVRPTELIEDRGLGLRMTEGCRPVTSDQMIALMVSDAMNDRFDRSARQVQIARWALDPEAGLSLWHPLRTIRTADAVGRGVRTDLELSWSTMDLLSQRIGRVRRVELRSVPASDAKIAGKVYQIVNQRRAKELFTAIGSGAPLPEIGKKGVSALEPSDVELAVLNGTPTAKLAAKAADELRALGFTVVQTGNAPTAHERTIVYHQGELDRANLIATTFGGAVKQIEPGIPDLAPVVLVLGGDYEKGQLAKLAETEDPAPDPRLVRC